MSRGRACPQFVLVVRENSHSQQQRDLVVVLSEAQRAIERPRSCAKKLTNSFWGSREVGRGCLSKYGY